VAVSPLRVGGRNCPTGESILNVFPPVVMVAIGPGPPAEKLTDAAVAVEVTPCVPEIRVVSTGTHFPARWTRTGRA
jgi:hypothetical protein